MHITVTSHKTPQDMEEQYTMQMHTTAYSQITPQQVMVEQ